MATDPSAALEARWFDKMNEKTSGVYRLAHAVRQNDAQPFKPEAIFHQIEETAEQHLAAHISAVSMLTARSPGTATKKTTRSARK